MDKTIFGQARQLLAGRLACRAQHPANGRGGQRAVHLEQHENALGGRSWRPASVFQVGA